MNVEEILKTLTVDEKIGLLSGDGDWHTSSCNGKVPVIMMTDGPHGLRKVENEKVGDINTSNPATCFPTASAIASSWDPEVAKKMANAIANEAKQENVSIVLGCGTNIKRSPLCGRNFEYFSEDPFLAGKLAASYIKEVEKEGVGASLKHFAANSQETRRMTSNSEIDERALREIYLPAFEEAVKEGKPSTVMCSYNRTNGEFGSRNRHLLKEVLRDEWGFDGAVVSDWGATNNVVECYRNGLTLEMPDCKGYHKKVLKKAYEAGEISDEELDKWAEEVLRCFSSLSERKKEESKFTFEEHEEIAGEIEGECAVLLKNDGVLPIDKDKGLIIIGDMAVNMRFQGGGSSHINPTHKPNAVRAFETSGYIVKYIKGYNSDNDKIDKALEDETIEALRNSYKKGATKILFFIGLTDQYEGEGYDRKDINLPMNQVHLLERISNIVDRKDLAAISFGGAPMDFFFDTNVGALLHMYLGGQAVDRAIVDLVSGKVNPSGKLAETMPYSVKDTPANRYFALYNDDVEYRESIFVGYRYYETFNVQVKYPFGYGLSYTKFEYSDLKVNDTYDGGKLKVSFNVKNVGTKPGKEVTELYVLPKKGNFIRSAIELKGFKKVFLNPGEEKEVEIELTDRSFSVFDVSKNKFSVIEGEYEIAVGGSIKDLPLRKKVSVKGEKYFRDEKELFPDYFKDQP
ncbi:MAG: glycoside hydrolase family 3 C-terminal domain-containing protein, partial [Lachnospiraceae bacterium]|nr:glycoside hydrolase family 3 C-terminal domain-containing protein [Lachnospiraceae bacterium]